MAQSAGTDATLLEEMDEGVSSLHSRKKWFSPCRDLQVDDVVLVISPDAPRGTWKYGRVIRTHPGKDGHVRVVDIQTYGCTEKTRQQAVSFRAEKRLKRKTGDSRKERRLKGQMKIQGSNDEALEDSWMMILVKLCYKLCNCVCFFICRKHGNL